MKLIILKKRKNALICLRRLSYTPHKNRQGKASFIRRLHGYEFPRFHLYIYKENNRELHCSIHLDQTAPIYNKGSAHRGDYDSSVVKDEVKRLVG